MDKKPVTVEIPAPNFDVIEIVIEGTTPYVQNAFSKKAREQMKKTQEAGSTSGSKKNRTPKDFRKCYEDALHQSEDGWYGIPASAFRNGMISACKTVNYVMTRAKLAVFIEANGFDKADGTPLVKITKGKPKYCEHYVRIANNKTDIRARGMWMPGWRAKVTIRYDKDMFQRSDVVNLMVRVGMQVGIGEGRNDSKNSCGVGWGLFTLTVKSRKDSA